MAESFYYQDNGQTIGPLAPAALKQLANQGVIRESTPVRKGEQGAWYQAGTIAGLVTPRPASAATSAPGAASEVSIIEPEETRERVRQTFRKAEQQADKVASTLWFLDLKFQHFVTPRLIGLLWLLYLGLLLLVILRGLFDLMWTIANVPSAGVYAIGSFIFLLYLVVMGVFFERAGLELLVVLFRIGERVDELRPELVQELLNRDRQP